jgi:NAD(P)H-dependent FMN reductase
MSSPHVVAVCGSLRTESYTRTALKYALRGVEAAGGTGELLDLSTVDLPLFDPDLDEQGDSEAVLRTIRAADAVALGSPVYHSSYSSAFRNVHDYCGFDEYEDTAVGLLCVAGGGSYGSTLEHMRSTVRGVHGHTVPQQVGIRNAYDRFVDDSSAPDGRAFAAGEEDLQDRLEDLGAAVVEAARRLRPRDENRQY